MPSTSGEPEWCSEHRRDMEYACPQCERGWGVYVVNGPSAGEWCTHEDGARIETDEKTARTLATLFVQRFDRMFVYEAVELTCGPTEKCVGIHAGAGARCVPSEDHGPY